MSELFATDIYRNKSDGLEAFDDEGSISIDNFIDKLQNDVMYLANINEKSYALNQPLTTALEAQI